MLKCWLWEAMDTEQLKGNMFFPFRIKFDFTQWCILFSFIFDLPVTIVMHFLDITFYF